MSEIKINAIPNTDMAEYTQAIEKSETTNETQSVSSDDKKNTKMFNIKETTADEYTPGSSDNSEITLNGESVSPTAASELDMYDAEKQNAEQKAEDKKVAIRKEIAELVKNDENISNELKKEFSELSEKQEKETAEYEKKKQESDKCKRNIEIAQAEIKRREAEKKDIKDDERKSEIESEIESYTSDIAADSNTLSKLTNEMNSLKSSINSTKKKIEKIYKKIEKTSAATSDKIKQKEQELKDVDKNLDSELDEIAQNKKAAEEKYYKELLQAGQDKANYENIAAGYTDGGPVSANAASALARATGEIGVRERTGHNDGAEIDKYRNGAANGAAWCASFVSWCYKGNDVFGYCSSVSGIMQAAQQKGKYAAKGQYSPKAGDVMIQKNNGASHTGIVEKVDDDGTIHTIEGNASNSVRRVTYRPGSKGYNQISGWVKMS